MSPNVWYVLFPSSTYIALQPLCVFDLSSTSSTYFNIHLLWLVLISSTSSTYIALQPLCIFDLSSTSSTYFNIHLLWLVLISSTSSTYIALQPLCVFDLSSTSSTLLLYSIQCIQCYVSQHLQHQTMCIDTYWHVPFNVHTTDKVTMGANEWLPHYLIRSRSHCNSNFNSK